MLVIIGLLFVIVSTIFNFNNTVKKFFENIVAISIISAILSYFVSLLVKKAKKELYMNLKLCSILCIVLICFGSIVLIISTL